MSDLLEELTQLFEEHLPQVDFRQRWGWGSRLLEGPAASGETVSRTVTGDRAEVVLAFTIFAPEPSQRENTAESLEALARQYCPGCVEVRREEEREDSLTRLPCLPVRLVFTGGESAGLQGVPVTVGGKTYHAAEVSLSVSFDGTELTAVGEDVPFAVKDPAVQYRVELSGIHAGGLELLASFTAEVGDAVYTGCHWKELDFAGRKAVFLASGCEKKEESL
ncbi:MAG: hypothetical protein ACOYJZ_06660 [Acutalibacter sp.]|jgi:hypothetical protein